MGVRALVLGEKDWQTVEKEVLLLADLAYLKIIKTA